MEIHPAGKAAMKMQAPARLADCLPYHPDTAPFRCAEGFIRRDDPDGFLHAFNGRLDGRR